GVTDAIAASRAKIVYVCNLMTKPNETPGYTVEDFVATIAMYLGRARLDAVLVHLPGDEPPPPEYAAQGSEPVVFRRPANAFEPLYVTRSLATSGRRVRHDPEKLAAAIADLVRGWFGPALGVAS